MSSGGKDRGARAARERTRVYQARQTFHDDQRRRRTRDNLIAGIGGGLLILALVASQTVYFTSGPGAPGPEPTPSTTSTPQPSDTSEPQPSDSSEPQPSDPAEPQPSNSPTPVNTDLPQPTPTVTE